ncbi:hypothetical protein M885DRAFT_537575 [Pelagophyceae sp. CCMP2097]|nr:hypothetical protein M885DRAFT_537575 [Pelagophyceae sp. CCMP2097]|mmetsp:Transcript_3069/g.9204  ORF Transcript_3069/g.9204 Transcript_3069/m.9204 type:complete len:1822 (+) Transcript_3069:184-5649(+)
MEVFLKRSLEKIRKAAKSNDVKKSCDAALASLDSATPAAAAEAYFEPLRLACESQQGAVMQEALDCVQKLIAYGYLRGATRGASASEEEDTSETASTSSKSTMAEVGKSSMDAIVATVCGCDDFDDDNVQLQVIKALLTAVTSNTCEIHEGSLLLAVRSCYNIQLVTRNAVNRTTAKATLTQMLSIVFQRMEAHEQRARQLCGSAPHAKHRGRKGAVVVVDCKFEVGDAVAVPGFGDGELRELRDDGSCVVALHAWRLADGRAALLYAKAAVLEAPDPERTPAPRSFADDAPPPGATLRDDGALVVDDDDEEDDDDEDDEEDTADAAQSDQHVKKRRPQSLAAATPFASPYHKDAFLLFRALCKLSMKGHDADPALGAPAEPISMQSKVLSLELLLSVLEHAGESFKCGARFIGAVRQYLCVSLLKNCTSNSTTVVALSLRIFVALIVKMREHLKSEVEVFISNIFLRILGSDNSTHEHKILVLDVFHNLCNDARSLVELFLSYDADFDSIDIFRSIVVALSRVVKGAGSSLLEKGETSQPQRAAERRVLNEAALRRVALSGLIATLQSLARCSHIALLDDDFDSSGGLNSQTSQPERRPFKPELPPPMPSRDEVASSDDRDFGATTDDAKPPTVPASGSVESFDLKQRIQEDLRDGILQFNQNPKKGLQLLATKGHVQYEPPAVARFLHQYRARLNKTAVGEFLGREKEYHDGFCVKVLHNYVDLMDFSGMEFDIAIRHFLEGFRLPGEAQKIDRMMEKFAERFCIVNPQIFPSADVAFVLAFSVIMLQTDLHNPAVKEEKKMTKDGFRRNNRGISNGDDMPGDFLDGIFERIKSTPITLAEDDKQRQFAEPPQHESLAVTLGFAGANPTRKKAEAFHREREDMVRASVSLLRQGRQGAGGERGVRASAQTDVVNAAAAHKMFEVAWGPALSAFSHALESTHPPAKGADPQNGGAVGANTAAAYALDGLKISATVAAALRMDVARDAIVNALASFTNLYKRAPRSLEPRHVACIDALLSLARHADCAEALGASWLVVLQVASRVSHLRLVARGLQTDDAFFGQEGGMSHEAAHESAIVKFRDAEDAHALHLYSKLTESQLDCIYARSTGLSAQGVEHFVTHLCVVSHAELSTGDALEAPTMTDSGTEPTTTRPRVYSLGRLVDVADANVATRPRLAWDRMWRVLAAHFERAGSHANADVAKYAVDALRQLSLKFLGVKDELRDFTFQRAFLRPFEVVFARATKRSGANRAAVREYVVQCVDALVRARSAAIRSGWRSIFQVYSAAAVDSDRGVAELAYAALDHVATHHLDLVAAFGDFVELVNCVVAFAAAPKLKAKTAVAALDRLDECSKCLATGRIARAVAKNDEAVVADEAAKVDEGGAAAGSDAQLELWWPLLLGLAQRVADPRLEVRNRAIATLRRVLERDCAAFSSETWRLVFRGVLFPALESAWTDDATKLPTSKQPTDAYPRLDSTDEKSWLASTAPQVLDACVALYGMRSADATLLSELLALLSDCVCQDVEALTRLAVRALTQTLAALPQHRDAWDVAAHGLAALVDRALPGNIKSYFFKKETASKDDREAMLATIAAGAREPLMANLVAALQLQPLCSQLLVASAASKMLDSEATDAVLAALAQSRDFARHVDGDALLRGAVGEALGAPAELVAQHVGGGEAAFAALNVLAKEPKYAKLAEQRLLELAREVLDDYAKLERAQGSGPADLLRAATPLALDALAYVKKLDSPRFKTHAQWLVPVLSELIVCQSVDLRTAVAQVFASRVPSALSLDPDEAPDNSRRAQPETTDLPPRRIPGAVVKPYRLFES